MDADDIRHLRERLGMTQAEFADHIGTNHRVVSRWEKGLSKPRTMATKVMQNLNEDRRRTFGEDGPVYDAGQ